MNIAVTGYSGTGKTTVSRLLAQKLDKKLISTDDEIVKKNEDIKSACRTRKAHY